MARVVRIYSTSGTTGAPSYIPLTRTDLADWIEISVPLLRRLGRRGRAAARLDLQRRAVRRRALALDAFQALGLCHIPVGPGNTERLLAAVAAAEARRGGADAVLCAAPGGAGGGARHRPGRRRASRGCSSAGEPGGGEPELRARLEAAWGAKVTEAHGDRRHRRLALGRVRGAGRHAFLRPRLRAFRADRSGDRRAACRSRTAPRASSSIPTCATRPRRCCASAAATTCACGPAPAPAAAPRRGCAASAAPTTC